MTQKEYLETALIAHSRLFSEGGQLASRIERAIRNCDAAKVKRLLPDFSTQVEKDLVGILLRSLTAIIALRNTDNRPLIRIA